MDVDAYLAERSPLRDLSRAAASRPRIEDLGERSPLRALARLALRRSR